MNVSQVTASTSLISVKIPAVPQIIVHQQFLRIKEDVME
jgi:hypothetical protein